MQIEQKADNLIGSHPPEDMSARARAPFPQNTYSVQDWINRATVPPRDNLSDEDKYMAALRVRYLHAARVIARFMKSVKKTVK